jgi:hypothetical protein
MTAMDLCPPRAAVRHRAAPDPDPRVRHRADARVLVAAGVAVTRAAALMATRAWPTTTGSGTGDRRPGTFGAGRGAIAAGAWRSRDHGDGAARTELLGRPGYAVRRGTGPRTLHAMGYRDRHPRQDRTHRQAAESGAAVKPVLAALQPRGLVPGLAAGVSPETTVTATPLPTWPQSGHRAARP